MIGRCNPFNIRHSAGNNWLGSVGQTRGFVDFVNMDFGIRAAAILIMRTYRKKNVLTVSEIINRFAPKCENDTSRYIDFVCSRLSCFPFDIPDKSEYASLLSAMSVYEGNSVSYDDIAFVLAKFHIVPYKKIK